MVRTSQSPRASSGRNKRQPNPPARAQKPPKQRAGQFSLLFSDAHNEVKEQIANNSGNKKRKIISEENTPDLVLRPSKQPSENAADSVETKLLNALCEERERVQAPAEPKRHAKAASADATAAVHKQNLADVPLPQSDETANPDDMMHHDHGEDAAGTSHWDRVNFAFQTPPMSAPAQLPAVGYPTSYHQYVNTSPTDAIVSDLVSEMVSEMVSGDVTLEHDPVYDHGLPTPESTAAASFTFDDFNLTQQPNHSTSLPFVATNPSTQSGQSSFHGQDDPQSLFFASLEDLATKAKVYFASIACGPSDSTEEKLNAHEVRMEQLSARITEFEKNTAEALETCNLRNYKTSQALQQAISYIHHLKQALHSKEVTMYHMIRQIAMLRNHLGIHDMPMPMPSNFSPAMLPNMPSHNPANVPSYNPANMPPSQN